MVPVSASLPLSHTNPATPAVARSDSAPWKSRAYAGSGSGRIASRGCGPSRSTCWASGWPGRTVRTSSSRPWGDGAKLELFGSPEVADGPWLFESNPVVAGFLVDDREAARDGLARIPDVELLGELRVMPDGYGWQHFRAPDGHVYELTADPAAAN